MRRLFCYMHRNLFGPTKVVCYREVSTVRGVCYIRGSIVEEFPVHCLLFTSLNLTLRMELLTNAGDNDAQLLVLLNVTDLLASCCEGDNPFIESICQTIFSIDELLGVSTVQYVCIVPHMSLCILCVCVVLYINFSLAKIQFVLYGRPCFSASSLLTNHCCGS